MPLNRLRIGETASGALVGGGGGNDAQLVTRITTLGLSAKRHRWASRFLQLGGFSVVAGVAYSIFGYSDGGDRVKSAQLWVSAGTAATGQTLRVRMWKSTTRNPADTNRAFIIPASTYAADNTIDGETLFLPIEIPYIATGEFWELELTPPAVNGWSNVQVSIELAALHRA